MWIFAGMFFLFVAIFIVLPFALFTGLIGKFIKNVQKKQQEFSANSANIYSPFIAQHGGRFIAGETPMKLSGSFSKWTAYDVLESSFNSGNKFFLYHQSFDYGDSQHRPTPRSVVAIAVPDIRSQFLIKSKQMGANQSYSELNYNNSQSLQLEGDFSEYFTVLAPEGQGQDLLVLLGPNVMDYILLNFPLYDIEIADNWIYIYTDTVLAPETTLQLLGVTEEFIRILRLRNQDARAMSTTAGVQQVARAATDNTIPSRLIHSPVAVMTVVTIGVFVLFNILNFQSKFYLIIPLMLLTTGVGLVKSAKQHRIRKEYTENIASRKPKD